MRVALQLELQLRHPGRKHSLKGDASWFTLAHLDQRISTMTAVAMLMGKRPRASFSATAKISYNAALFASYDAELGGGDDNHRLWGGFKLTW